MSQHQEDRTFKADGTRPIESGDIQVADSFEEDGIRPIAKSPDYLVGNRATENNNKDNCKSEKASVEGSDRQVKVSSNINKESPIDSNNLEEDNLLKVDGERPVDNSEVKVVDTFEEDGTRPIMANKYQVVDTLNVDAERPITSE